MKSALYAVIIVLTSITPAFASSPVPVPEPTTIALLSAGVAVTLGAHWFRRK